MGERWRKFTATGEISDYLEYKNSAAPGYDEAELWEEDAFI